MGKNIAIIVLAGLLLLVAGLLAGSNPQLFGEWPALDFLAREARVVPLTDHRRGAEAPSHPGPLTASRTMMTTNTRPISRTALPSPLRRRSAWACRPPASSPT